MQALLDPVSIVATLHEWPAIRSPVSALDLEYEIEIELPVIPREFEVEPTRCPLAMRLFKRLLPPPPPRWATRLFVIWMVWCCAMKNLTTLLVSQDNAATTKLEEYLKLTTG